MIFVLFALKVWFNVSAETIFITNANVSLYNCFKIV